MYHNSLIVVKENPLMSVPLKPLLHWILFPYNQITTLKQLSLSVQLTFRSHFRRLTNFTYSSISFFPATFVSSSQISRYGSIRSISYTFMFKMFGFPFQVQLVLINGPAIPHPFISFSDAMIPSI